MQKQQEAKLLMSLLASFSRMTDQDRIALDAFAKASARQNPRARTARMLAGSSRRELFYVLRHADDLLSSLRR